VKFPATHRFGEAVIAARLKRTLASSGFRYAVTAVIGIRHAQRLGTAAGSKNGGDSEKTTPAVVNLKAQFHQSSFAELYPSQNSR
jgi:hypothetical protein